MLERPCSYLIKLARTVDPAVLVLSTSPARALSASERSCPVRATGALACARTKYVLAGRSSVAKPAHTPSHRRLVCIDSSLGIGWHSDDALPTSTNGRAFGSRNPAPEA